MCKQLAQRASNHIGERIVYAASRLVGKLFVRYLLEILHIINVMLRLKEQAFASFSLPAHCYTIS